MNINMGQEITIWDIVIRLLLSTVLGTVIGMDREISHKPAGLRTHCLVAIGAAVIAIVERCYTYEACLLGNSSVGVSLGRITVGVITGVGFLGSGTIFMKDNRLEGLTTAASLWCTACIGLAVGMGYYVLAVISIVFIMIILAVVPKEISSIKKHKS